MGGGLTDRLFLGVALSDDVRYGLAAFLAAWAGQLPGKPGPPQNWHLTLRFLGSTEPETAERVLAALDEEPLTLPFVLGFAGLGAFPRPRAATVLWLGVDRGTEGLAELAGVCEEVARDAGFDPDERPFHPHVTLSRIRPKEDVADLVDAVPPFPLSQEVDRITLYRSLPGPGGARYQIVDEVPL
jgi:RNA 2',3'-cyclic 3'-phosphodiesterase